jgi:cytochrome b561
MIMAVPRAYSLTQKGLHWLVALMVFILVPVGFYMSRDCSRTTELRTTGALATIKKVLGKY